MGMDRSSAQQIGKRMAEVRKGAQLSQTELAAQLGTTQNVVSRYEQGGTLPALGRFLLLCEKTDANPCWVLTGKGAPRRVTAEAIEKLDLHDEIGSRIEAAYMLAGLSRSAASSQLGVSVAQLGRYVEEEEPVPEWVVFRLADMTGLSVEYVFWGPGGVPTAMAAESAARYRVHPEILRIPDDALLGELTRRLQTRQGADPLAEASPPGPPQGVEPPGPPRAPVREDVYLCGVCSAPLELGREQHTCPRCLTPVDWAAYQDQQPPDHRSASA